MYVQTPYWSGGYAVVPARPSRCGEPHHVIGVNSFRGTLVAGWLDLQRFAMNRNSTAVPPPPLAGERRPSSRRTVRSGAGPVSHHRVCRPPKLIAVGVDLRVRPPPSAAATWRPC